MKGKNDELLRFRTGMLASKNKPCDVCKSHNSSHLSIIRLSQNNFWICPDCMKCLHKSVSSGHHLYPLILWSGEKKEIFSERGSFQFNFLKKNGLMPHHRVLEIGVGSMTLADLLIPYLDVGHYYGIDRRDFLIDEATRKVTDTEMSDRNPSFIHVEDLRSLNMGQKFDFICAFSVLIHMTDKILHDCLSFVSKHMGTNGVFYANTRIGDYSTSGGGAEEFSKSLLVQIDANNEPFSVACRHGWLEYPVFFRNLEFFTKSSKCHNLRVEDLGGLSALGYDVEDKNIIRGHMLEFYLQ